MGMAGSDRLYNNKQGTMAGRHKGTTYFTIRMRLTREDVFTPTMPVCGTPGFVTLVSTHPILYYETDMDSLGVLLWRGSAVLMSSYRSPLSISCQNFKGDVWVKLDSSKQSFAVAAKTPQTLFCCALWQFM
jgi:hypothetical protein